MRAKFTWTCAVCGERREDLTLDEVIALDRHECTVALLIRRAAKYVRARGGPLDEPVAVWLDAMADQARSMSGPTDFSVTDEPSSVQYALAVARALPDEEEL